MINHWDYNLQPFNVCVLDDDGGYCRRLSNPYFINKQVHKTPPVQSSLSAGKVIINKPKAPLLFIPISCRESNSIIKLPNNSNQRTNNKENEIKGIFSRKVIDCWNNWITTYARSIYEFDCVGWECANEAAFWLLWYSLLAMDHVMPQFCNITYSQWFVWLRNGVY